jgi:hypothetical protein
MTNVGQLTGTAALESSAALLHLRMPLLLWLLHIAAKTKFWASAS